ncbi:hypothetical protein GIB67_006059 [Kingdonia uniflora]|uniref:Autophagy protein 5 n=1 Tax=Kingdonia uniflora TaxID=39325 RepID=A0A7J7LPL6_9MAGN|nr:hypothetical protein GIB67_006059 [Kingdonia uniflora]
MALGNMEGYFRISSKLRLGTSAEEYATKAISDLTQPRQTTSETDISGSSRTDIVEGMGRWLEGGTEKVNLRWRRDSLGELYRGRRVPVRLYVRYIDEAIGDLTDVPSIDSWDEISYINRPVEILREDGKIFTLHDALKILLPEFFEDEPSIDEEISLMELKDASKTPDTDSCNQDSDIAVPEKSEVSREIFDKPHAEDSGRCSSRKPDIKFVRVQGIKPKFDIPFNWLVKNLMYAEHFIHICVYVGRTHD